MMSKVILIPSRATHDASVEWWWGIVGKGAGLVYKRDNLASREQVVLT